MKKVVESVMRVGLVSVSPGPLRPNGHLPHFPLKFAENGGGRVGHRTDISMKIFRELSYWWTIVIGLLFPILQGAIYYIRFGILNPYAPLIDYILFFLAGTLGGLVLIALLQRSHTKAAKWSVIVAYLLGTPIAFLGSLGGGLFGPVGVILLPVIIWAIFTAIGFGVGRLFFKGETKQSEE